MNIEQRTCPRRIVVQGAIDDIVDPMKVRSILSKNSADSCKEEIIINNQMGHRIDLQHFKHYVDWFFMSSI